VSDVTGDLLAGFVCNGWTLAVAESLTGGLLVAELTRPSGASAVVRGGVVAYATELKYGVLDVDGRLLDEHGPVHPDVAAAMAERVRRVLAVNGRDADVGVSTTGVAGPDSQGGRPPGTAFVGVCVHGSTHVIPLFLSGTRDQIRHSVVQHALSELAVIVPRSQENFSHHE
jgi:nicotinamide-nucleotide amidase